MLRSSQVGYLWYDSTHSQGRVSMRECPTCKRSTEGAFCPVDGDATEPQSRRARPTPSDLPRAWDAPAPRQSTRLPKETLVMTKDADGRVGAAEVLSSTDEHVEHEVSDPSGYGRADSDMAQSRHLQGHATQTSPPAQYATRHAPSEVPWERGRTTSSPYTSDGGRRASTPATAAASARDQTTSAAGDTTGEHRATARMSGGWGDALFGGVGKSSSATVDRGPKAVSSEPRPHPIPVDRIAPAPKRDQEDDQGPTADQRGLISTMLVIAIVGSSLYFGGQFLWEKLQRPPQRPPALAPSVDVPPPPPPKDLGGSGGIDEEDEEGEEVSPLLVYRSTLSRADHLSAKGVRLKRAWQVIVNDRRRVHLGQADKGDKKDPRFGSEKGRAELIRLLRARRLSDEVRKAIRDGAPTIELEVWPDQVTVRVISR